MKFPIKALSLLAFIGAALAYSQTIPPGTFKHIIIVVQENRTPDNLFGGGGSHTPHCGSGDAFEPGVDLDNGGYGKIDGHEQDICNISLTINGTPDPDHHYQDQNNHNYGWLDQYDNGNMDGFCEIQDTSGNCVQYSYVQKADVQPYFDIATSYGFANYMFQTNEGPSFPAHQFLFTGTSAPTAPNDPNSYYLDFVAENADMPSSGCAQTQFMAAWVNPMGTEIAGGDECYPHDSLVTNASGDKGFSWRYYTPTPGTIWTAPASIPEVCYGMNSGYTVGQPCSGSEWSSHIVVPDTNIRDGGAPILSDIQNCNLQQISWVIPDEHWSDHAGGNTPPPTSAPYGPSWVGDIIDAVGNSWQSSNHQCDYWGVPNSTSPEPTVIFVVWDDWGGWFDHVSPEGVPKALREDPGQGFDNCDPSVMWGCGYVYGFRVPLLVVSEYTQAGYVSGACTTNCPNTTSPYVHDFGSILAFTEWNFGMPPIAQAPGNADSNAPDGLNGNIPLLDFFSLSNRRDFTAISTPYSAEFFETYYFNNQNYTPTGPDGDADD